MYCDGREVTAIWKGREKPKKKLIMYLFIYGSDEVKSFATKNAKLKPERVFRTNHREFFEEGRHQVKESLTLVVVRVTGATKQRSMAPRALMVFKARENGGISKADYFTIQHGQHATYGAFNKRSIFKNLMHRGICSCEIYKYNLSISHKTSTNPFKIKFLSKHPVSGILLVEKSITNNTNFQFCCN